MILPLAHILHQPFPKSCHSFFPVPLSQVSSLFAQLSLKFRPVCPLLGSWEELPNPSSSRFAAKSKRMNNAVPSPCQAPCLLKTYYIYLLTIQFFHLGWVHTGSVQSTREVRIAIALETESQRARKLTPNHSKAQPIFEPKSWNFKSKYCLE